MKCIDFRKLNSVQQEIARVDTCRLRSNIYIAIKLKRHNDEYRSFRAYFLVFNLLSDVYMLLIYQGAYNAEQHINLNSVLNNIMC